MKRENETMEGYVIRMIKEETLRATIEICKLVDADGAQTCAFLIQQELDLL